MMTFRRRLAPLIAATAVLAGALTACAPPEPAHPLGARCTWPADLDIDRDQLAVLHQDSGPGSDPGPGMVTLVHVPTGTIRARCVGVSGSADRNTTFIGLNLDDVDLLSETLHSPLSPDLRYALSPAGTVELATGALTPHPPEAWPATELLGAGAVLRRRPDRDDSARNFRPVDYCVAPTVDSPQHACRTFPAAPRGYPVNRGDGTAGWAPATPVPIRVTTRDGRVLDGIIQTDGTKVVLFRLSPPDRNVGPETAHLRLPTLADILRSNDGDGVALLTTDERQRLMWYSVDTLGVDGATAALHLSPERRAAITALPSPAIATSSVAVDDDTALVTVFWLYNEPDEPYAFFRNTEDGPSRLLFTLTPTDPLYGDGDPDTPPDDSGLLPNTTLTILAWPDTADPTTAP